VLSKTLFLRSSKRESIDAETIRQLELFEVKPFEGSLFPAGFSVFHCPFSNLDRIFLTSQVHCPTEPPLTDFIFRGIWLTS
jgi:hypothetical protein